MNKRPLTKASQLPERLRYLQPFRSKFASRRPEDLNEDSEAAPLMALLSKRIHGLSLAEAADVLEQDRAALDQWLSALGQPLLRRAQLNKIATDRGNLVEWGIGSWGMNRV